MYREKVLEALLGGDLKCLSNRELCKLFKFLSCFFCCLDRCESDDDHKPEPKPDPDKYPCYCPYFPCKPNKDK